jgi:class 3 adenylate cyclase
MVVANIVRALAAGKGLLLAELGDVAVRGFEDPVRLFEVCWREEG